MALEPLAPPALSCVVQDHDAAGRPQRPVAAVQPVDGLSELRLVLIASLAARAAAEAVNADHRRLDLVHPPHELHTAVQVEIRLEIEVILILDLVQIKLLLEVLLAHVTVEVDDRPRLNRHRLILELERDAIDHVLHQRNSCG